MNPLRIGTRGSALALWQANAVAALLARDGRETELVTIRTEGDRIQDRPLSETGGKGLFVKDLEDALLAGTIDLAVHSAKDMSVTLPPGLAIAAVLPREDSRDALVLRQGEALAASAAVGTGSVRRSSQLTLRMPSARFLPIRGNVDTRLRKLDTGEFDALVLAVAGLTRLGLANRVSEAISHDDCIPAPCQGIVAIETRLDGRRGHHVAPDQRRRGRGRLRSRACRRRGPRRRLPAAARRRRGPRGSRARHAGNRDDAGWIAAGPARRARATPAGRLPWDGSLPTSWPAAAPSRS